MFLLQRHAPPFVHHPHHPNPHLNPPPKFSGKGLCGCAPCFAVGRGVAHVGKSATGAIKTAGGKIAPGKAPFAKGGKKGGEGEDGQVELVIEGAGVSRGGGLAVRVARDDSSGQLPSGFHSPVEEWAGGEGGGGGFGVGGSSPVAGQTSKVKF